MTSCPHCQQSGAAEGAAGTGRRPLLEKLLPDGYVHLVCSYEETAQTHFRAQIKLRITSEGEVHKWLEDFQTSSGVTWRISKTYPNSGRYNAYRVNLRCQHNTFPKSVVKKTKNTSCGATMYLMLKRHTYSQNRKSRSGDPHIKDGYLLNVNLKHEHNHPLSCADAVRRRAVSDETVAKLKTLFESGHSPSSALHTIKFDLQEQEGDNYLTAATDHSICPDIQFCFRLYYRLFQRRYRSPSGEELLVELQDRLQQYNRLQADTSAKMEQTEDGQLVVAVCTPLMKRVHTKLRESGEIIFVDSSGNCGRQKHRIFLLLTHSAAGGLPLGVIVTTSESQSTITAGLQLLQTLLPGGGFFGRKQPQVVMTDDCRALRQSLQAVFPEAKLLLCVFHQLQAMWRWLWNAHNGVAKQDRPQLLNLFKSLVYADSTLALIAQYNRCLADAVAMKYPRFLHHLAEVYERHEEWAVCLRDDFPTRGPNGSSFVESAVKVMKEKVLHRLKAYNATQLVDFVTSRMEGYYVRRLNDVANNRMAGLARAKPLLHANDVDGEIIVQVDQNHYVVQSATSELQYDVNLAIGCCTCAVGVTGAPCKHQNAILSKFGHHEIFLHVTTPQMRRLYREIATGSEGVLPELGDSSHVSASPGRGTSGEQLQETVQPDDRMELPDYSRQLMQQLWALKKEGHLCDCTILVGDSQHRAHKLVLAASSMLFRSLLDGSDTISIDTAVVSSQEFGCLLDMVYTGRLPVGKHNVSRIVAAAESLQMFDVAVGFKNILSSLVSPPAAVPPAHGRDPRLQNAEGQTASAEGEPSAEKEARTPGRTKIMNATLSSLAVIPESIICLKADEPVADYAVMDDVYQGTGLLRH
ncbi:uncharacterized protein LOC115359339 isoform X1 [Myripristis murdjan]|uniref:uncharacterized protein LOC115359339 isoform X1 n=1 Tax=Myripristis murdjan TaxID=586833 RepID=UPI0011763193|nr:uncharacterized protein LOC115359339 isoform X1 [Myripristis murdjan]